MRSVLLRNLAGDGEDSPFDFGFFDFGDSAQIHENALLHDPGNHRRSRST